MTFWVVIKKKNKIVDIYDHMLPGIIPAHVLDMMVTLYVQKELRLCENCALDYRCHVMQWVEKGIWRKLCPVLFHDAVRPEWKIKDLA